MIELVNPDELESDILLRMYYEDYFPVCNYDIVVENENYYVTLHYNTTNFKIHDSKIFQYIADKDRFKVIINKYLYHHEYYDYLSKFDLQDSEKLFIVSAMLGNRFTKLVLPDSIRAKVVYDEKIRL